jgi:hypothetical protein
VTAEEELEPVLADLRRRHDTLPFLDRQISASEAVFRPLPDDMVDLLVASSDFSPPERGSTPVWTRIVSEGGRVVELVLARPAADGELWVIAPAIADD